MTFPEALTQIIERPGVTYMRMRGRHPFAFRAYGIESGNIVSWRYIGSHDGEPVTWDEPEIVDSFDSAIILAGGWEVGDLAELLTNAMNAPTQTLFGLKVVALDFLPENTMFVVPNGYFESHIEPMLKLRSTLLSAL